MVTYVLAEEHDCFPFGYATEQFLAWLKNDVHNKLEQSKKERKEAMAKAKKEVLGSGGVIKSDTIKREEDTGVVKAVGNYLQQSYDLVTNSAKTRTRAQVKIVDRLYNSMRAAIKDILLVSLRMDMAHPKPSLISGAIQHKGQVQGNDPSTEINKTLYNPALSRRVKFKQVPIFSKKGKAEFININFMYHHQDYEAAYRCDVEKTENSDKLAIKKSEEQYQKDEDFVPFETSYKKTRQIMLYKKFESIYENVLQGDENDHGRIDKLVAKEKNRQKKCRLNETLATKGVSETYEEKHIIKAMLGPFYKYVSKDGLKEDDFITSAQQDLIDYASTPAPRILLLGKPRSGKTTIGQVLSKRLDLVHINVENWLQKLLEKKKKWDEEMAENPPPQEGGSQDGEA